MQSAHLLVESSRVAVKLLAIVKSFLGFCLQNASLYMDLFPSMVNGRKPLILHLCIHLERFGGSARKRERGASVDCLASTKLRKPSTGKGSALLERTYSRAVDEPREFTTAIVNPDLVPDCSWISSSPTNYVALFWLEARVSSPSLMFFGNDFK